MTCTPKAVAASSKLEVATPQGGEGDVVHSPGTARAVADRLGATFKTMPGMSHWLVGEPGWEAVARSALSWLEETVSLAA